jgi:hypothetical protein
MVEQKTADLNNTSWIPKPSSHHITTTTQPKLPPHQARNTPHKKKVDSKQNKVSTFDVKNCIRITFYFLLFFYTKKLIEHTLLDTNRTSCIVNRIYTPSDAFD